MDNFHIWSTIMFWPCGAYSWCTITKWLSHCCTLAMLFSALGILSVFIVMIATWFQDLSANPRLITSNHCVQEVGDDVCAVQLVLCNFQMELFFAPLLASLAQMHGPGMHWNNGDPTLLASSWTVIWQSCINNDQTWSMSLSLLIEGLPQCDSLSTDVQLSLKQLCNSLMYVIPMASFPKSLLNLFNKIWCGTTVQFVPPYVLTKNPAGIKCIVLLARTDAIYRQEKVYTWPWGSPTSLTLQALSMLSLLMWERLRLDTFWTHPVYIHETNTL